MFEQAVMYTLKTGPEPLRTKEDTIMTSIDLTTLTPEQRHLENLRIHGARIRLSDGDTTELNSYFVGNAINACIRMGVNAITYEMTLPGIDEPMAICIHRNGHIDSGSEESIRRVLNR